MQHCIGSDLSGDRGLKTRLKRRQPKTRWPPAFFYGRRPAASPEDPGRLRGTTRNDSKSIGKMWPTVDELHASATKLVGLGDFNRRRQLPWALGVNWTLTRGEAETLLRVGQQDEPVLPAPRCAGGQATVVTWKQYPGTSTLPSNGYLRHRVGAHGDLRCTGCWAPTRPQEPAQLAIFGALPARNHRGSAVVSPARCTVHPSIMPRIRDAPACISWRPPQVGGVLAVAAVAAFGVVRGAGAWHPAQAGCHARHHATAPPQPAAVGSTMPKSGGYRSSHLFALDALVATIPMPWWYPNSHRPVETIMASMCSLSAAHQKELVGRSLWAPRSVRTRWTPGRVGWSGSMPPGQI